MCKDLSRNQHSFGAIRFGTLLLESIELFNKRESSSSNRNGQVCKGGAVFADIVSA
jgi:hypothetical protein